MLESRATGNEVHFYAYLPKNSGERYFHDPISNKVYWEVPQDAIVIDGKTSQTINTNMIKSKKEISRAKSAIVINEKNLFQIKYGRILLRKR